jgi:hypothetical protein
MALERKYYCVNIISSTVMRGILLTRNDFIFNKQAWSDVKAVLIRIQKLIVEWKPIYKEEKMEAMMRWSSSLDEER